MPQETWITMKSPLKTKTTSFKRKAFPSLKMSVYLLNQFLDGCTVSLLVQKVDNTKPANKGMGEQVSGKIAKFDGRLGLEGY